MDIKRRKFFERAGLGSAALLSLPVLGSAAKSASRKDEREGHHSGEQHENVSGPLASATVSFGHWSAGLVPSLDRFPNQGAPVKPNGHQLIPYEVKIKAGGTVSFIVAGFHHILVYGDGTQPGDIDTANTISVSQPPGPPLINDPTNRVYRGLDPSAVRGVAPGATPGSLVSTVIQDRVEVVGFPNPGTFLVICGVLPHFQDGMYGFVKVNP
jgi:plastocyanin